MMTENFYKEMIDYAPFGYSYQKIIVDENDRPVDFEFIEINKTFEKITGFKSSEIIKRRGSEVIKNFENEVIDLLGFCGNAALNGKASEYERYFKTLRRWFKIQIYSHEKYYFSVIYVDITSEKEKSEDLERFFSINLDLLCIADTEGNFIKLNKAWEATLGYPIDFLENKKFLDFIHPDDMEKTLGALSKLMENENVYGFVNRYRCKDGSYKYIEWRSAPYGNIIYAAARDISTHINLEASLRRKHNDIISFINNLPFFTWIKDIDGKFVEVNDLFAKSCGFLSGEELAGKSDFDVWPQELAKAYRDDDLKVIESKERKSVEEFINDNGTRKWFETYKAPRFNENNEVIGTVGFSRDISERKRIEEKLQISEKNFRTFFETIDDMIFIADQQGVIFHTNNAVTKKLGYTHEELNKMHVLDVHPENKRAEAEIIFTDMFAGKRDVCPLPLARKDKTLLPVETRVWFGSWDETECIFGISKDISREQEALQMFNKLFMNNPALMALTKQPEGIFSEVNEAFLDKTGYKREDVIGKSASELGLFTQPARQRDVGAILSKYGKIRNVELEIKTATGEILDGLFSGEIIESQGKSYFLTVMTDITAQKKAEKDAINASKAKSEFLANMSHEIRTPLNGVIGFSELLINTNLTPEQKQYARNINISAHSLLDIINDVLDFSKIEAGRLELDEVKTDIIELLEQTSDIVKYNASKKDIEFLLNIQPSIPRFVYLDPVRLRQVIINLLSNAIKFTEKGEIELSVKYKIEGNSKSGDFIFSVRDTGIGISKEQEKKLFKAFSQADASTTRRFGGTGLGLVISNKLVEKMGGKIELDSKEGEGSRFFFIINKEFEYGEKYQRGNIRDIKSVLIVDDNKNNQTILSSMLSQWGINSVTADDGLSSLDIIENKGIHSFDIVIVDYNMPNLNGVETISNIRRGVKGTNSTLPAIILCSSSEDEEINRLCKEKEIHFKLVKPVKSVDLFNMLCSINAPENKVVEENSRVIEESKKIIFDKKTYSILIAEDVTMNMMLIKAIIKDMLHEGVIIEARDGVEAVENAMKMNPDMILMDIQMPLKDGYEATREIREREKGLNKHTPIIALTAGSILGEKERCLEAGMDDFLTKPIDPKALSHILNRYLDGNISTEKGEDSDNSKEIDNISHFNKKEFIDKLGDNEILYKEMISISILQWSLDIESLENYISVNDIKMIKSTAHKIKGAALTMSCSELADLAIKIEASADLGTVKIKDLLTDIKLEFDILKKIWES